jgi:hypothetical protein
MQATSVSAEKFFSLTTKGKNRERTSALVSCNTLIDDSQLQPPPEQ